MRMGLGGTDKLEGREKREVSGYSLEAGCWETPAHMSPKAVFLFPFGLDGLLSEAVALAPGYLLWGHYSYQRAASLSACFPRQPQPPGQAVQIWVLGKASPENDWVNLKDLSPGCLEQPYPIRLHSPLIELHRELSSLGLILSPPLACLP